MTRRVILDANGVKVSDPSVHADEALPYQLLFSSDFCFPGLVIRGTRYLSVDDLSHKTITIPYGRSFTERPVALVGAYDSYNGGSSNNSGTGVNWSYALSGSSFRSQVRESNGNSRIWVSVTATAQLDHLQLVSWLYQNNMSPKPMTLHYAVFSYTL